MIQAPVTTISGIGPATASVLATETVHVVGDLLRVSPERVHLMVDELASLDECRRWRQTAALLEIEPMQTAWADALLAAGLRDVEDVSRADHGELAEAFAAIESADERPDANAMHAMSVDARTLWLSGALLLLVVDESSEPVGEVDVVVADKRATTDARGRCRVARIPFPATATVTISGPGIQTATFDGEPISPFSAANWILRLEVERLPEGVTAEPAAMLDEWNGDELPSLASYSRRTVFMDEPLREGDYVFFARRYAGGNELKLTSVFRMWQGGRLLARAWRLPVDVLPADATEGQLYRHADGELVPKPRGPFDLDQYRARRRVMLQLEAEPDFASLTFHEALERFNAAMQTATVVGRLYQVAKGADDA